MYRFFISPESISDDRVTLEGGTAAQIARVLRGRPGDTIVVLDGSGLEYRVELRSVSVERVIGDVTGTNVCEGEPDVDVTLYQAIIKGDKFEYVLQKGTELGVSAFVPVVCERSVPNARRWGKGRYERWRTIAKEAAEQSGRGRVPRIEAVVRFGEACAEHVGAGVVPWEMENSYGLKQALGQIKGRRIGIFVGPEGGITSDEIGIAGSHGIRPVTLGRRILRAETASVAAVAAVMYELGELGG
jgi:16S rRNA (uracil1498-N3)-methyltransferase